HTTGERETSNTKNALTEDRVHGGKLHSGVGARPTGVRAARKHRQAPKKAKKGKVFIRVDRGAGGPARGAGTMCNDHRPAIIPGQTIPQRNPAGGEAATSAVEDV
ncbi:hypothetical protein, partial [Micromonospora globispora]|uniref:hypothetical protein n=1 Tax=Micromonospora globispora TaxID=1450148 RepID=UPI001C897F33